MSAASLFIVCIPHYSSDFSAGGLGGIGMGLGPGGQPINANRINSGGGMGSMGPGGQSALTWVGAGLHKVCMCT